MASAAGRCQAASLDTAEMFAHGVDFANVGPGGAERARDLLLVGQRYAFVRRREQSRTAAGDEADTEIVRLGRREQLQDFFGADDASGGWFVEAGWPRGMQMNRARRPQAIGRHVHPASK